MFDYRIAIINNGVKIDFTDDLERWREYEAKRSGLNLLFSIFNTNIPIVHESFGTYTITDGEKRELYGLTDVQQHIRATDKIPQVLYHAAVFLYDFDKSTFDRLHPGASVGHWTRYGELYQGTEFIEIATTRAWDKKGDVFRVLTHEIRHAHVNRARRKGFPVIDVMDLTPVLENGNISWIPYYLEFAPTSTKGNRAMQDNILSPNVLAKVAEQPALELLVRRIMSYTHKIMPQPTTPRLLEKFCEAIKKHEGWYPGSRSYRQNNPGNLRWSKYQIGTDGNFAIFPDYATGWKALLFQVEIAANGKSRVYRPDMTFYDFFAVYAPASDNNVPTRYAEAVAAHVGVPPTTRIRSLIS